MLRPERALYRFVLFFLATLTVILGLLGLQVERRNDALHELQMATARVERAAVNTEQVLIEVVEARDTPEAVARNRRVTEALSQIETIIELLCQIDDPVRAEACAKLEQ